MEIDSSVKSFQLNSLSLSSLWLIKSTHSNVSQSSRFIMLEVPSKFLLLTKSYKSHLVLRDEATSKCRFITLPLYSEIFSSEIWSFVPLLQPSHCGNKRKFKDLDSFTCHPFSVSGFLMKWFIGLIGQIEWDIICNVLSTVPRMWLLLKKSLNSKLWCFYSILSWPSFSLGYILQLSLFQIVPVIRLLACSHNL